MKRFREFVAIGLVVALSFVGLSSPGHAQIVAQSDSTVQAPVYFSRSGLLVVKAAAGPGVVSDNGSFVYNARVRTSIANVNAGATLLPAIAGYKYRLIDVNVISVGGAVGTCTAVVVLGTQAAGSATLTSAAAAALTRSANVKPGLTNVSGVSGVNTVLADGASYVQNDVNTAITIGKTGGACDTATHIDAILTYAIES